MREEGVEWEKPEAVIVCNADLRDILLDCRDSLYVCMV